MARRVTCSLAAFALILSGCGGGNPVQKQSVDATVEAQYEALLAQFPISRQGYHMDGFGVFADEPMTYGLILLAEARRFRATGNAEALERCRRCVTFLTENKDVDQNGVSGWSLDRDWDAFGDGSVNPKGTVYAITTGIILDGLMEFYEAAPFEDRTAISALTTEATLDSASALYAGGVYVYSESSTDQHFVPNASAYFAGAVQRVLRTLPQQFTIPEKLALQEQVDSATSALVAEALPTRALWPYHAKLSPFYGVSYDGNDLVHHMYIVYGLRSVARYGGAADPYSATDHSIALQSFDRSNFTAGYSSAFPGDLRYPNIENRYSDLWGIGSGIVLACELNQYDLAKTWITRMTTQYGLWPRPYMWPTAFEPNQNFFFGRHGAHAVWAMSRYLYR